MALLIMMSLLSVGNNIISQLFLGSKHLRRETRIKQYTAGERVMKEEEEGGERGEDR